MATRVGIGTVALGMVGFIIVLAITTTKAIVTVDGTHIAIRIHMGMENDLRPYRHGMLFPQNPTKILYQTF